MKTQLLKAFGLVILAATGLCAQSTLSFTFPGTNEPAVTALFSAGTLLKMQSVLVKYPSCTSGALASAALSTDTTITVGNTLAALLSAGSGLLIDSEVLRVSSISVSVATVTRGMVGTTAAAHSNFATVLLLLAGSYGEELKLIIDAGLSNINGASTNMAGGFSALQPAGGCTVGAPSGFPVTVQ